MSTSLATTLHTAGPAGAQALWPRERSTLGPPVQVRRVRAVVRPARHVRENGRLAARVPAAAAAVGATATSHLDEMHAGAGTAWIHGPHDTSLCVHPATVTGFRLTRGEV
ncbi:pyridoxamine 5'-phosphate oxidase family protein [Streptomyces sp. NPDC092370]|uniref:pyridoxamine 5'-phosphate oxidase family protein n=1 Tax=Streptomyces sp. NPDC092370 TaxID=3366016 RepID=UPI0037F99556